MITPGDYDYDTQYSISYSACQIKFILPRNIAKDHSDVTKEIAVPF